MYVLSLFNSRRRKIIAITLIMVMGSELLVPYTAMALTAGPTSPEATSFEPVDTTDMVNPLTGSFTYNMPLLEVPGPEGGYPLSLSYHAGISPNLEASWVGLGWTLNPGAINRNVNGFPDDFSDVNIMRRDYWAGGNRHDFGLSVGFANTANIGLVFSQDTYQGFGVGLSAGIGFTPFGSSYNIGVGVNAGIDAYGDGYVGAGVGSMYGLGEGLGLSAGLGVQYNFNTLSVGGGVSLVEGTKNGPTSLLGVSMSSSSLKPNLAMGGGWASVMNNRAGRISTSGGGIGFDIPIGYGFSIGLSYRYTRYWSDETSNVLVNGTLRIPQTVASQSSLDNRTYDIYRLPDHPQFNIVDHPDENQLQGGTFPEYDNYSVTAQGIGGNIRPHIYQSTLYSQNKPGEYVATNGIGVNSMKMVSGVQFRFLNDFSNSYRQNSGNITSLSYPFSSPVYGNGDSDNGYQVAQNRLAGSKAISYFTNAQIINNTAKSKGFVNVDGSRTKGYVRLGQTGSLAHTKGGDQIGGFMVTNESGVTYHYALPVYSFNEYIRTQNNDNSKFTYTSRAEPYAYTWLLTAVTGPDYVDRNNDGLVNEGDWGYWVGFDYGKWTNAYHWRNPATGNHTDLEQGYKSFSRGTKELYYLNAIRTRTHIALFEKEVRMDGKGGASSNMTGNYGSFDHTSAHSLRLNKIYLLNASDANLAGVNAGQHSGARSQDMYHNVLDNKDVDAAGRGTLESKAIRIVDFAFDYSLTKKTLNSFDLGGTGTKYGKLTLKNIHLRGKGGAGIIPPTVFQYEEEGFSYSGNLSPVSFTSFDTDLEIGDMLETIGSNPVFCGIITHKTVNGTGEYIYSLTNGQHSSNVVGALLRKTKNPPYNKDAYDTWGMYKSDINMALVGQNENLARAPSIPSANSSDAWCLRKMISATGAEINLAYESNDFHSAVVARNESMIINNLEKIDNTTIRATIDAGIHEPFPYAVGSVINALFLIRENPIPQVNLYHTVSVGNDNPVLKYHAKVNNNQILLKGSENFVNVYFQAQYRLVTGNLDVKPDLNRNYGGGVRVKAITIGNLDGSKVITHYAYVKPNSTTSSGVVSYIPNGLEPDDAARFGELARKTYRRKLFQRMSYLLTVARELPAPSVMYEYVTVSKTVSQSNGDLHTAGRSIYQYRVYGPNMFDNTEIQRETVSNNSRRNNVLRDFTTNIGDLLSVVQYDEHGKKIREIKNVYIYDGYEGSTHDALASGYQNIMASFNHQGVMQERYGDGRSFNEAGGWKYTVTMQTREKYPSILLRQTSRDFITGTETTTRNLAFDFYSGVLTQSIMQDSYGNRFLTEQIPAYRKYGQMGLKTVNESNKHMLAQSAGSITYKVNAGNTKLGVVSATAQTWSNALSVQQPNGTNLAQNSTTDPLIGNVWRMRGAYSWMPTNSTADGLTAMAAFTPFDWGTADATFNSWVRTSTITRYNVYSKALESADINSQYATTRYGYNHSKVTVSGGPAKYREIAFSGVEDETINGSNTVEVLKGSGVVTTAAAHTGTGSLLLSTGQSGFEYTVPAADIVAGRNYSVSVWVRPVSGSATDAKLYYQVNSTLKGTSVSSGQSNKVSGGWTLVTLDIKGSDIIAGSTLKVALRNDHGVQVYADDFRFQPANAGSAAYVYDKQSGELSHVLDGNNLYTRYEYDQMGSLKAVYTEQFGRSPFKVQEYQQHYREYVYRSNEASGIFVKNNCSAGSAGNPVTYTVSAGTYTSTVSQAAADAQAQAAVNANGQAYANANGTCETVQRTSFVGQYRQQNACNATGQVPATVWIGNNQVSALPAIPADMGVTSGIIAYANSTGSTPAQPGWYRDLYGDPSDGTLYRMYEVGPDGEIQRYVLCSPQPPPTGNNIINLFIADVDGGMGNYSRKLEVSAQRTYSVNLVITGRVSIFDQNHNEVMGGSNFSIIIPSGSSHATQDIFLDIPWGANVTGRFVNLVCNPSSADGVTIQLQGLDYYPIQ